MSQSSPEPLLELLAAYDTLVEVGIGRRTDLAEALLDRGATVTATDIEQCPVPDGVDFVVDDVTDPDRSIYTAAEAIYARRLPPELQRPTWELARNVGAACFFTTLGGDPALVPAETRTTAAGTVHVSLRGDPGENPF